MEVFYVSKEKIQEISLEKNLQGRFEKTRTIPGTQRLHHFCSIEGSPNQLKAKPTSNLEDSHYKTYSLL